MAASHPDRRKEGDVEPEWKPRVLVTDVVALSQVGLLTPLWLPCMALTLVLSMPPLALLTIYARTLPSSTRDVASRRSFQLLLPVVAIAAVPLAAVVVVFLVLFLTLLALLSLPWAILSLRLFTTLPNNLRLISKWNARGALCFSGMAAATVGAVHRQGFCEYWPRYGVSFVAMPLYKYALMLNPLVFRLSEHYCNQWTPDFKRVGDKEAVVAALAQSIGFSTHKSDRRDQLDTHEFAAHYVLPPRQAKDRAVSRTGTQYTNKLVTFTDTRHVHGKFDTFKDDTLPRSHLADCPIFQVTLYARNPFHFLTGYVEVNVQESGQHQVEHPMWLIAGQNYFSISTIASVDAFFHGYGRTVHRHLTEDVGLGASKI